MRADFVRKIKGLRFLDRSLLTQIQYLSEQKGYCFAKNSYFSDFFYVSEGTIKRSLKKMEALGLILRMQAGWGRRYIYVICSDLHHQDEEHQHEEQAQKPHKKSPGISGRILHKKPGKSARQMPKSIEQYPVYTPEIRLSDTEQQEADMGFARCFDRWRRKISGQD